MLPVASLLITRPEITLDSPSGTLTGTQYGVSVFQYSALKSAIVVFALIVAVGTFTGGASKSSEQLTNPAIAISITLNNNLIDFISVY